MKLAIILASVAFVSSVFSAEETLKEKIEPKQESDVETAFEAVEFKKLEKRSTDEEWRSAPPAPWRSDEWRSAPPSPWRSDDWSSAPIGGSSDRFVEDFIVEGISANLNLPYEEDCVFCENNCSFIKCCDGPNPRCCALPNRFCGCCPP